MARQNHEQQVHKAIYQWLLRVLPPEAAATLHHCANGENRNALTASLLKEMGVKPGWPDLAFLYAGFYYGLEVKVEADKLRGISRTYQKKEQRECEAAIVRAGGFYAVCRSIDDARWALGLWQIPLNEKPPAGRTPGASRGRHVPARQ